MALLFFDGFENAAVANDLTDGKWDNKAGTLTTTIVNTRFSSGRALELSGTDGVTKDITIANTETAYIGFALVVRSVTTTPQTIFTFFQATAASGPQFYIRLNSARKLEFVRGAPDTGTVLGTTTLDFPDDVWRYVEVKLRVHATLGTLEVKINGAVDITELTSQDTEHDAGTGVASLGPGGTGSGAVSYEIDDLYINDDTGSLNNDYLGDSRIQQRLATADSAVNFTHLSGSTNWEMIDEPTTPDDDTTYNHSATATDKDLFVCEDTPTDAGTIHGVSVTSRGEKDDATTREVRNTITADSTIQNGATVAMTNGTYVGFIDIFETEDATNAWSSTAFDGLIFGYEVVT